MTDRRRRRRRERHVWSAFELNTAIALICKGSHKVRPGSSSGFAVELNKALNSRRANFHEGDIDEGDIEDLLRFLLTENKAAVAFAERTMPACITRSKRMAFSRRIDFTGSMTEWDHGGRKDAVMGLEPRLRRRAVLPSPEAKRGPGLDDSSSGGGDSERSDGPEMGELRERGPQKPLMLNLPSLREAIGDVYHMADPGNAHHAWRAQGSNITLPSLRDQPWAGLGGIGGVGHQPALQAGDINRMTGTHREWTAAAAAAGAQSARDGLGGGTQQGVANGAVPAGADAGATSLAPCMSSVDSDGRISTGYSTAPTGFPFQDFGVGGDVAGRGMSNNNSNNGQQPIWGNIMSLPVGQGGSYDENSRPGPTGPPSTCGAQGLPGDGGWQRGDATGTSGGPFDRAPPPTLGSAVMTGTNNSNSMTAPHGHGPYSGNGQGFWSGCSSGGFYDANAAAAAAGADDLVVPGSSSNGYGLHNVDPAHLTLGATPTVFPSSPSGCGGAQYDSGYRHLRVTNIEAQQQYKADGRYGSSGATTASAGEGESGRPYPVAAAAAAATGPTSGGSNVVEISSSTGTMAQGQGWEPVTGGGGYTAEAEEETAVPLSYGVPPQQHQQ